MTWQIPSRGWCLVARRLVVGAVVFAALLASSPAAAGPADAQRQLEETRQQLEGAEAQLDGADRLVLTARDELAAIDATLAEATAELAQLEDQLATAEAELQSAVTRTEQVNERLRAGDARLADLLARARSDRDRLRQRAAQTYMYGGGARSGAMYGALLGATDLHHMSMGLRVVEEALAEDQRVVERSRQDTLDAAAARTEVAALRAERQREEAASRQARDAVAALLARQSAVHAEVAAEHERRAAILARTEQDRAQAEALVRQLQQLTSQLTRELLAAIDVQWQDLQVDGPMPEWAGALPARGQRWAPAIAQAAAQVGLDPRLLAAVVWAESAFHQGAVSHAGAIGLAQLMPGTAAGLGVDPTHPLQNLAGGARYLAIQYARFGSVELALAAYNAGPGAVARYGGIPPYAETQYYVVAVLTYYQRLL